jgi:hypothetical protein
MKLKRESATAYAVHFSFTCRMISLAPSYLLADQIAVFRPYC